MTSEQTIVLITGANQGVGFETAKNLLLSDVRYHILLGSRDITKGNEAVAKMQGFPTKGTVEVVQIDVSSDESVDAAAKHVQETHARLDTLVNNAGIIRPGLPVRDAMREVLATNLIGAASVTEAFLPLLRKSKSPRLIFVSSSTGSLTHASTPGTKYHSPSAMEYRSGKAALNMVMVQYWIRLKDEGFVVIGADPGLVATNFMDPEMLRKRGAAEPEVGGERVACVVRGDRDDGAGKLCGEYGICPW
ncbi:hypothetical protein BP5796_11380 [Coleophoma crateriformis]|uniref:Uncharacterized protein n=1 Tax=Coleophoma crateriformis TaxID=565419 RepID=A0A3D8QIG3_9HELO|nr:hypothetical protein BP5796_11380 [Coleophoma crateriformis]